MKLIKLTSLAFALGVGSTIAAASPCDGFQLKVKNSLADDLLVTEIKLDNANLAPGGIQKIDKKIEQAFTVNNSAANGKMEGRFVFKTISIPVKTVDIKYTVENTDKGCYFETVSLGGDYSVEAAGLGNYATFNIINK